MDNRDEIDARIMALEYVTNQLRENSPLVISRTLEDLFVEAEKVFKYIYNGTI